MYHPICSSASLGVLDAADSAPVAPGGGYDSPKMTFPRKVGMAPNSPASKTDLTNLTTNHNHYSSTVCITTGVQMVFRSARRCHKVLHVFPICQHLKSLWLCSQGTTKFHHIEMDLDRRFDVSACGISPVVWPSSYPSQPGLATLLSPRSPAMHKDGGPFQLHCFNWCDHITKGVADAGKHKHLGIPQCRIMQIDPWTVV